MNLGDWQEWWKTAGRSEIRTILMRDWDPIGVAGIPEAIDEYDSYVGRIGKMLFDGAGEAEISEFLRETREIAMGLGGESGVFLSIARLRSSRRRPGEEDVLAARRCVEAYRDAQSQDRDDR